MARLAGLAMAQMRLAETRQVPAKVRRQAQVQAEIQVLPELQAQAQAQARALALALPLAQFQASTPLVPIPEQ
jgi:hypothetical protein